MRRPLPPRARAPHRPRSPGIAWQARSFGTPPYSPTKLDHCAVAAAVDDHIIHELSHHRDTPATVHPARVPPATAVPDDYGRDVALHARLDVDRLVHRSVG